MIRVYAKNTLGEANHGWLNARHHFSFAGYYNKDRMRFGTLRVINDDTIEAGQGFGTHPHQDMEIITYVRQGAITHRDSQGNVGRTEAGQVQVMSAGTGIFHSEYNLEESQTSLYQIWIEPKTRGVEPRWQTHQFPKAVGESQALTLLVSGDGQAPLSIHQNAYIYAGSLGAGKTLDHPLHHQAYLLVSEGEVLLEGQSVKQGDGAEITDQTSVNIQATKDAKVLVIDVPSD